MRTATMPPLRQTILWTILGVTAAIAIGCRLEPQPIEHADSARSRPLEHPGLHNVLAFHDGLYSGSVPEGDAGFDSLARLGVRTIISVDGAEPDVARARARSIRTIHLPIGYDGIDESRRAELARATRDARRLGPVYMHCHHGKHRSAAAAATTAVSLGWAVPELMTERMRSAGTSPAYPGLYAAAADATAFSPQELDSAPADFPEVSRPTTFVHAMVELDGAFERLSDIESSGWQVPVDHPDLIPAVEAARMVELFRAIDAAAGERDRSPEFAGMLREALETARFIEESLAARDRAGSAELSARLARLAALCNECHTIYRN